MADGMQSVIASINDVISRIKRLENPSDISSIVLRLDLINRMLLNLDVADNIVNTMVALHDTTKDIDNSLRTEIIDTGYTPNLNVTGRRGRPSFIIPRQQLSCLLLCVFTLT